MSDETKPKLGRPALSTEEIDRRVAAYCQRYRVEISENGLPPFPSGKRETRQHREWLSLYRARQRHDRRAQAANASRPAGSCVVCGRPLELGSASETLLRPGRNKGSAAHAACGELARAAEAAGPEAVAGVARLLWPGRRAK